VRRSSGAWIEVVMLKALRFVSVMGLYTGTASMALQAANVAPCLYVGIALGLGASCAALYDMIKCSTPN
jgi:hypothetical protein